jgi:hypothetical protein
MDDPHVEVWVKCLPCNGTGDEPHLPFEQYKPWEVPLDIIATGHPRPCLQCNAHHTGKHPGRVMILVPVSELKPAVDRGVVEA